MSGTSGGALAPLLFMLVIATIDAWVYLDAKARADRGRPVVFSAGSFEVGTPVAWLLGCLVLFVVFLPLYLTSRTAGAASR
ncbi:hypothetical protein ACNTMW_12595 [Planosporangium sp. 12N6]|uniref:hypothetical protein n=1 Tax=Planosporangium spinosum TaxID=3402278 RepID=UPI003CEDBA85